jgi:hypothetical protein
MLAPIGPTEETRCPARGSTLKVVWHRDRNGRKPIVALPGAQLTEQDGRFVRGLADWPFALLRAQRAWLRHLAERVA